MLKGFLWKFSRHLLLPRFFVTNIKLVCWQKQTKWIFITKIVQAHKHVQKFRIDINNLYDMLLSVVYDQNHYFDLGPIPKPKLK